MVQWVKLSCQYIFKIYKLNNGYDKTQRYMCPVFKKHVINREKAKCDILLRTLNQFEQILWIYGSYILFHKCFLDNNILQQWQNDCIWSTVYFSLCALYP